MYFTHRISIKFFKKAAAKGFFDNESILRLSVGFFWAWRCLLYGCGGIPGREGFKIAKFRHSNRLNTSVVLLIRLLPAIAGICL